MAWELEHSEDLAIVKLTIRGLVTGQDLLDAAAARITLGKEKGVTEFVIDAQELIAPRSATLAVLDIPTKVYVQNEFDRRCGIAVIPPTDPESDWITHFYEDICFNRGWRIKIVEDIGDAISWLRSTKPSAG